MTDMNSIKAGDIMCITDFVKVDSQQKDELHVTSLDNQRSFRVIGKELVEEMKSADIYAETKKVSRTEMAKTLSHSFNTVFTVTFRKQDRTSRTLRGRLLETEPLMGRSKVEDLDANPSDRFRLVDHRTLEVLIVNNVKYRL